MKALIIIVYTKRVFQQILNMKIIQKWQKKDETKIFILLKY